MVMVGDITHLLTQKKSHMWRKLGQTEYATEILELNLSILTKKKIESSSASSFLSYPFSVPQVPKQSLHSSSLIGNPLPVDTYIDIPWLVSIPGNCQGIVLTPWLILSTANCLKKTWVEGERMFLGLGSVKWVFLFRTPPEIPEKLNEEDADKQHCKKESLSRTEIT